MRVNSSLIGGDLSISYSSWATLSIVAVRNRTLCRPINCLNIRGSARIDRISGQFANKRADCSAILIGRFVCHWRAMPMRTTGQAGRQLI